jgi:NADPH-dependent curcumin reductase
MENRQVRLAQRPTGMPGPETWEHTTEAVPELGEGEVHVAVKFLSLDPAMRGWMNEGRSYIEPVGIGEVFRAGGVGEVVASRSDRFAEGQWVTGMTGAQEHAVLPADGLFAIDPQLAPAPTYLGALGMTGMTAYFGLFDVGEPQPGDTVVVSGAAGATGSVAGQLAKLHGCRVVGIAGGEEKCRWVEEELGFDACVDYKGGDLRAALKAACPDRIDVYFDNVGGEVLDVCLGLLDRGARVVICGAISQYNAGAELRGPANYLSLLVNRARMQGFVVFDYASRYGEAAQKLGGWLASGELVAREDVVRAPITAFGDTLLQLFEGANTGKLVLELE